LNSNITDRKPRRGRRRDGGRSSSGRSHGKSRTFERRPSSHPPALTPIDCDTTPLPFTSLPIDARLLEGVRDLGFTETRPVQSAVIPLALNGDDLIACAETGTGKTCAFVLPTLQRLLTAGASAGDVVQA
jgi:superfamily II DNA/RNA helicase